MWLKHDLFIYFLLLRALGSSVFCALNTSVWFTFFFSPPRRFLSIRHAVMINDGSEPDNYDEDNHDFYCLHHCCVFSVVMLQKWESVLNNFKCTKQDSFIKTALKHIMNQTWISVYCSKERKQRATSVGGWRHRTPEVFFTKIKELYSSPLHCLAVGDIHIRPSMPAHSLSHKANSLDKHKMTRRQLASSGLGCLV